MHYLIAKIFLYLLAAAVIGGLIGYWLSKSRARSERESIDDWRMKYNLLEEERDRQKTKYITLKNKNMHYHDESIKLNAGINELKERGNNISQQRDDFESKYTALMHSYNDDVARQDKEQEERASQLEAANLKVEQLLERVTLLSSEKTQAKSSLELIQGERDQLSTQLIDLSERGDEARNHLRLVNSERDKLTQEMQVLSRERENYEDRLDSLVKDQQILATKVVELKQERDDYIGRLRTISEVADRVNSAGS